MSVNQAAHAVYNGFCPSTRLDPNLKCLKERLVSGGNSFHQKQTDEAAQSIATCNGADAVVALTKRRDGDQKYPGASLVPGGLRTR